LPDVVLPFDDPELSATTVADVLADPARFEGCTLADPLEGVPYGVCKAIVMRRPDGVPWVHSFAHGRSIYQMRYDARAIEAALNKAKPAEAAATFVSLALTAELDAEEQERLRDLTSQRAGTGRRTLDRALKAARQEQAGQRAQENRDRRNAARQDPRPQLDAPDKDAPWLPTMGALNDVLGRCTAPEPPMRDADGFLTAIHTRRIVNLHALTALGANANEPTESRLPAPEEPLLTRLDEAQAAELIEQQIDYIDPAGQSVHLATPFVKHFLCRHDDVLPVVSGIATMPIVLPDGSILSGRGLR
jgi:hypothetical protein